MPSNLTTVPADRQCGAKTLDGDPRKNWSLRASGSGRMHGGKSYGDIAAPALGRGGYSRYFSNTVWRAQVKAEERAVRRLAARPAVLRPGS